jgi:hypothetical protein
MFRKLLKIGVPSAAVGGIYLSTKEKKVTTGAKQAPPTYTE